MRVPRGGERAQRGQVMAFIAVALAIVLMPLAGYAIDFRGSGVMTIDAVAAGRVARTVLAAEAPSASVSSVTVAGAEVTVAAGELVQLPLNFFAARMVRLEAHASARLAGGYDRPSSRLPLPSSTF